MVAILDADKEGYLRSSSSLIQTIGRASRNDAGKVIMYGDNITNSMNIAISETNRRRSLQASYNKKNNIIPKSIIKEIRDINERITKKEETINIKNVNIKNLEDKLTEFNVQELESKMYEFAEKLEFEKAAKIRDYINKMNN